MPVTYNFDVSGVNSSGAIVARDGGAEAHRSAWELNPTQSSNFKFNKLRNQSSLETQTHLMKPSSQSTLLGTISKQQQPTSNELLAPDSIDLFLRNNSRKANPSLSTSEIVAQNTQNSISELPDNQIVDPSKIKTVSIRSNAYTQLSHQDFLSLNLENLTMPKNEGDIKISDCYPRMDQHQYETIYNKIEMLTQRVTSLEANLARDVKLILSHLQKSDYALKYRTVPTKESSLITEFDTSTSRGALQVATATLIDVPEEDPSPMCPHLIRKIEGAKFDCTISEPTDSVEHVNKAVKVRKSSLHPSLSQMQRSCSEPEKGSIKNTEVGFKSSSQTLCR